MRSEQYTLCGGSPESDADASPRSSDPTEMIEATTKLRDEVCGLRPSKKGLVCCSGIHNREVNLFTCRGSSEVTSSSATDIWIVLRGE